MRKSYILADMLSTQLVVCGSIAMDRIMSFTGKYKDLIKPDKIHMLSLSPLLDKLENTRGGVGANTPSSQQARTTYGASSETAGAPLIPL